MFSRKGTELASASFRDDAVGQVLSERWASYLSSNDMTCFRSFASALTEIVTKDKAHVIFGEGHGIPRNIVQATFDLLLSRIKISTGDDNCIKLSGWLQANAGKNIPLPGGATFRIDGCENLRSRIDSKNSGNESAVDFLWILRVLSFALRTRSERQEASWNYGTNLATILINIMNHFTANLDEMMEVWSDTESHIHLESNGVLVEFTESVLGSILSLIQIISFSFIGRNGTVPGYEDVAPEMPSNMTQLLSCETISDLNSCEIGDHLQEYDHLCSTEPTRSLYNFRGFEDAIGKDCSEAGAATVLISIIRKLTQLTRTLSQSRCHDIMIREKAYVYMLLVQCEALNALTGYLKSYAATSAKQFVAAMGVQEILSIMTMEDARNDSDFGEDASNLLYHRGILCLNLSAVLQNFPSKEIAEATHTIASSVGPFGLWILRMDTSEEPPILDTIAESTSPAELKIPNVMSNNWPWDALMNPTTGEASARPDYMSSCWQYDSTMFTLSSAARPHSRARNQEYFNKPFRLDRNMDELCDKSRYLLYDQLASSRPETERSFNRSRCQRFFQLLYTTFCMSEKTEALKACLQGLAGTIAMEETEFAQVPIFQVELVLFLGRCLQTQPDVIAPLLWSKLMRNLLIKNPNFLWSGQRLGNRLARAGFGAKTSIVERGDVSDAHTIVTQYSDRAYIVSVESGAIEEPEFKTFGSSESIQSIDVRDRDDSVARKDSEDLSLGSEGRLSRRGSLLVSALDELRLRSSTMNSYTNPNGSYNDRFAEQMILLRDMIFELFWCSVEYSYIVAEKNVEIEFENIIAGISTSSADDIVLQTVRWLHCLMIYLQCIQSAQTKPVKTSSWLNVMSKALSISRLQVSSLANPAEFATPRTTQLQRSLSQMDEGFLAAAKRRPFFWPSRVAVLELMYSIVHNTISFSWIKVFIPKDKDSTERKDRAYTTETRSAKTDKGETVEKMLKHSILLRLVLDGRCTEMAASMVMKVVQMFAKLVFKGKSSELEKSRDNESLLGPAPTDYECLIHDLIRGTISIVRNASRQPLYVDGYGGAICLLKRWISFLRKSSNAPQLRSIFMRYGPMRQNHKLFKWTQGRPKVFEELLMAIDEATRVASPWTDAMKTHLVHTGLSLVTALLYNDDKCKAAWSRQLSQKSSSRANQAAGVHYGFNTSDVVNLVVRCEGSVSLQTLFIAVEMMMDSDYIQYMDSVSFHLFGKNAQTVSETETAVLISADEFQTVSNLSIVPLVFGLLAHAGAPLQSLVLCTFIGLVTGDNAVINMTKFAKMQPALIDLVIDTLPSISSESQTHAIKLFTELGRRTISVAPLKRVFRSMRVKDNECRHRHVSVLLEALTGMVHDHTGPKNFFYFRGDSSLLLPPLNKWPAPKGYTFSTWFTIREKSIGKGGQPSMMLLNLTQDNGSVGVQLTLKQSNTNPRAYCLAITAVVPDGPQTVTIDMPIESIPSREASGVRWNHIAISHQPSNIRFFTGPSEVNVFLNGTLFKQSLRYPRFSSPISKPTVGKGSQGDYFVGEMGNIYLFSDALSESSLQVIHALGAKYSDLFAELDENISSNVMLAISPGVSRGNHFTDLSPSQNSSNWIAQSMYSYAYTESDSLKCVESNLRDALSCLGGIQTLLPIFAQVDLPFVTTENDDEHTEDEVCFKLIKLIMKFLRDSTETHIFMEKAGFAMVAYFLERMASHHLTNEVLQLLIQYSQDEQWKQEWRDDLTRDVLCNFKIWAKADFQVQKNLLGYLIGFAVANPDRFKHFLSTQSLLDILHKHYKTKSKTHRGQPSVRSIRFGSGELNETSTMPFEFSEVLDVAQVDKMRVYILELIYLRIASDHSLIEDDVKAIMNHIWHERTARHNVDGLHLLIRLLPHIRDVCDTIPLAVIFGADFVDRIQVLMTNPDAKVRMYTLVMFCEVMNIGLFTPLSVPADTVSEGDQDIRSASTSGADAINATGSQEAMSSPNFARIRFHLPSKLKISSPFSDRLGFRKDRSGSRKELSKKSSENAIQVEGDAGLQPSLTDMCESHLESIGLDMSSLRSLLLWIQQVLTESITKSLSKNEDIECESHTIFIALSYLLKGLSSLHLASFVESSFQNTTSDFELDADDIIETMTQKEAAHMTSRLTTIQEKFEADLSREVRTFLPIAFHAVFEFCSQDFIDAEHRGVYIGGLRESLQSSACLDAILSEPNWQRSLTRAWFAEAKRFDEQENPTYSSQMNDRECALMAMIDSRDSQHIEATCQVYMQFVAALLAHSLRQGLEKSSGENTILSGVLELNNVLHFLRFHANTYGDIALKCGGSLLSCILENINQDPSEGRRMTSANLWAIIAVAFEFFGSCKITSSPKLMTSADSSTPSLVNHFSAESPTLNRSFSDSCVIQSKSPSPNPNRKANFAQIDSFSPRTFEGTQGMNEGTVFDDASVSSPKLNRRASDSIIPTESSISVSMTYQSARKSSKTKAPPKAQPAAMLNLCRSINKLFSLLGSIGALEGSPKQTAGNGSRRAEYTRSRRIISGAGGRFGPIMFQLDTPPTNGRATSGASRRGSKVAPDVSASVAALMPQFQSIFDTQTWVLVRLAFNAFLHSCAAEPAIDDPLDFHAELFNRVDSTLEYFRAGGIEKCEIECVYQIHRILRTIRDAKVHISASWLYYAMQFLAKWIALAGKGILDVLHTGLQTADDPASIIAAQRVLTQTIEGDHDRADRMSEDAKDGDGVRRSLLLHDVINMVKSMKCVPLNDIFPTVEGVPSAESLLDILRKYLSAVGKSESDMSSLDWELWDLCMESVEKLGKCGEEIWLPNRMTNCGLTRSYTDVWEYMQTLHSDMSHLYKASNTRAEEILFMIDMEEGRRLKDILRNEETLRKKTAQNWNAILQAMANERGPWGRGAADADDILWIVDLCENGNRQKPNLIRNYHGSRHTQVSILTQQMEVHEPGKHGASAQGSSQTPSSLQGSVDISEERQSAKTESQDGERSQQQLFRDLMKYYNNNPEQQNDEENDDLDIELDNEDSADISNAEDDLKGAADRMIKLFAKDEELFNGECSVITPSTNTMNPPSLGTIKVTKTSVAFTVKQFNRHSVKRTAEGVAADKLWSCQNFPSTTWDTNDICNVLGRFYQLRFVAVEIFFTSRTTVLIAFDDQATAATFQQLFWRKVRPPYLAPYLGRRPADIIQKLTVAGTAHTLTKAWRSREITNFEYLMRLNTVAGRTYNDLGQYPIFPWVLADYTSDVLNLKNPDSFRDLRWPMGAQNENQREETLMKYDDLAGMYETLKEAADANMPPPMPPFHFGSHYSVAGFVIWYLFRAEPYTSLHIQLQDGRFDRPDRMFRSLPAAWVGSTTNTADVKELIPEMFYNPEILKNVNQIDFGRTQDGTKVEDVELPKWASSAHDFIYKHRDALESEYVSMNLHHWIDLVFGYKQRPPHLGGCQDAADACNIFYHLTYAGAVNLDEIKEKDAKLFRQTIVQISEFGQTPTQLFTEPHPQRTPLHKVDIIWPIASIVRGVDTLPAGSPSFGKPRRVAFMKTLKVSSAALLFVVVAGDRLITVDANRLVGYHMGWQFLSPDMIPPFKVKVDDLAYDLSIGKADNKRTYVPDRVLGVPFVSFDSTAAAKIANMKPLTAAQYVKYDAQPRRHLAYEQDEPAAVVKRPAEETTSPQESMDAGGAREKLKRMLTFKSFKGSVSLKGSVSFKGSVGEEATELSESISNPSSDRSARQLSTDVKSANSRGAPDRSLNSQLFVHVPEGKVIFSGGHWDKSLRATSTENGRLIQKIVPHSDVITCVAYGQDFGRRWLVTGSRDCTVMVWSLGKELKLEPKPMHILCAHDDTVNVVAVCPELDIIASGADDGTIVIHALHSGAYVRSIVVGNALAELNDLTLMAAQSQQSAAPSSPNSAPVGQKTGSSDNQGAALLQQQQKATIACKVNWLGISKEGFIVAYSGDEQALVSYTLNGVYLAAKYVPERLYALTISDDGLVLLSGGDACLVVLRWIRSLTLANDGPRSGLEAVIEGSSDVSPKSPPFEAPIRSLYLTKNEHLLLVGLENGEVRALAQDSDYLRQRLQKKLLEIGIL